MSMLDEIITLNKKILKNQQKVLKNQKILQDAEEKDLASDQKLLKAEKEELEDLEELKNLEKDIKKELKSSPLKRVTLRDISKSIIGAFIGIMGHFAFFYGIKIAHEISMMRASLLYLVSFLIGSMFIYYSGYREIKESKSLKFIPLRILTVYITALSVVVFVLFLFGFANLETQFEEIYKSVAAISILAVLGACTADLIGKSE